MFPPSYLYSEEFPPSHLYSEVFPWFLPVEDGHGLKLWFQRVLADDRLHRLALTVDDDVGVGSYTESTHRLSLTEQNRAKK